MVQREITDVRLAYGLEQIRHSFKRRMEKHGTKTLNSVHEGLGIALEEWDELKDAVRTNDSDQIRREALDVIVSCLLIVSTLDGEEVAKHG